MTTTPTLDIRMRDADGNASITLELCGQLVGSTATSLRATARFVLYHPTIVIDLGRVLRIDPAGATALGQAIESMRRTGSRVSLVGANAGVEDALHLAGLDRLATLTA